MSINSLVSNMRDQSSKLSNVTITPPDPDSHTKKLAVVIPFGFEDRLAVCSRTLNQIILASLQHESFVKIDTIVIPNFCKDPNVIKPLEKILKKHHNDGALNNFRILKVDPHSAAYSFNRGAEAVRDISEDLDRLPDFTIKIDDDSRPAHSTIEKLVKKATEYNKHLLAPVTVRPQLCDFSNDSIFNEVLKNYECTLDGNFSNAPSFNHIKGKFDLSRLMLGYHTIFCSSQVPATPNENGMMFSADLLKNLLKTGTIFPEMKGGSEGLRLFLVLSQTPYADSIGVVKSGIYDRPIEGGQLSSWGKSDAMMGKIINDLGLMPDGIVASGFNDKGQIYSLYIPNEKKAAVKSIERLRALVDSLQNNKNIYLGSNQLDESIKAVIDEIYTDCKDTLDIIDQAGCRNIEVWGNSTPGDPSFVPPNDMQHQIDMIKYMSAVHLTSKDNGFPTMVYPV